MGALALQKGQGIQQRPLKAQSVVAEQEKTTRDSLPNNQIDLDADTIENHRRRKDAPTSKLTPRSGLVKRLQFHPVIQKTFIQSQRCV